MNPGENEPRAKSDSEDSSFLYKMTLLVRNLQRVVALNISKTKQEVQTLRRIMHIDRFDLAVLCVEDEKIRDLNRMYRGVDKVTDVLSFPASEVGAPGTLPDPWSDLADLGDIFLGVPYINNQCIQDKLQLEDVLPAVITHGLCHLIGFNHDTKDNWEAMRAEELKILEKFNKITGSNISPLIKPYE